MTTTTATISTVATTADQRTTRRVAANLRALGLNATARTAQANVPDIWAVELTYAEPMAMDDYLARLDLLEGIVAAEAARLR